MGTSDGDGSLWKLVYEYGELNTDGSVNANKNTGNIAKQTLSFTGLANPLVQTYKYDSLYHLTEAREVSGSNQTWKENFSYDRYGNRNFDTANTTTLGSCPTNVCNPAVNQQNNRLIGYAYDTSGNTKTDAKNRTFIYDGENKQVEVRDANGVSIGKYFYDGDGKRVKKISNTETTVFVYNTVGQLVEEYSTALNQTPQVSYLTSDHLGSPRINTDQTGQV